MPTLVQVVARGLAQLDLSQPQCIAVALSGGRDSVALLHMLAKLFAKESVESSVKHKEPAWSICALHVNHGLQADATYWAQFCNELCYELGIKLYTHTYANNELLAAQQGQGLEAAARQGRYRALLNLATQAQATVLALAHHQDDQAETVLLQIARGTGLAGAAAMPEFSQRKQLVWWRPLLSVTRAQIDQYVAKYKLRYIDDPSNAVGLLNDHQLRRNALRHRVMPALENAYPGASLNLARFATRAAQAHQELMAIAQQDWAQHEQTVLNQLGTLEQNHELIPKEISPLRDTFCKALTQERRANLLRYWLQLHGLPAPEQSQLTEIFQQWLYARQDAQPNIAYCGVQLRRFAGALYVARTAHQANTLSRQQPAMQWSPAQGTQLGLARTVLPESAVWVQRKDLHHLFVHYSTREGAAVALAASPAALTFRLASNRPARTLKQQFQAAQTPVWLREEAWVLLVDSAIVWVQHLGFNAGHPLVCTQGERFMLQLTPTAKT